ncbi:uncharacterized protein J3R85_006781 [Psidium guajava]|nr:uncharacterized protein J3R85_006781 [Psidium guajava]
MAKKILIDIKSRDAKRRAKARTIATDEATGLRYAGFNEEHGDFLVVIAERIDETTAVEKIRNAGMRDAELKEVKIQN